MDWCETPHVDLLRSNLGNRLYQFFAAKTLVSRCGAGTIGNAGFPEWGLASPTPNQDHYRRTILIRTIDDFDIESLAAEIRREPSVYIRNRSHLQRQEFYLPVEHYKTLFPIVATDVRRCGDDEILINIRAGDIARGFAHHYPLMPLQFYADMVRGTGLKPVFIGQLEPGPYIDALRERFPEGEFIASQGPFRDFETIRQARNIVPAISTFSLAAAWLSEAHTIYLPLNGFLNPAHLREIDLLPLHDHRYRFFQFPMNYALPEERALLHHATMGGWKEISHERAAVLRGSAPFIRKYADKVGSEPGPAFDEVDYVHRYPDVAWDISDGWYQNGHQHYLEFGRAHGYVSGQFITTTSPYPNLARRSVASQSSRSAWSTGKTAADDAAGAINGDRTKDYGFHTEVEHQPWWAVDCGDRFELKEIHVYNRKGERLVQERAAPLAIDVSEDGLNWTRIAETAPGQFFGVGENAMVPLTIRMERPIHARHVRISLLAQNCLHLAEVEVYGLPS